jgi:hypothetical protein
MFSQNTAYELVNNLAGCCNYWQGLFERGAHRVLTTIDPWHERRAAIEDYLQYISYIDEDSYE